MRCPVFPKERAEPVASSQTFPENLLPVRWNSLCGMEIRHAARELAASSAMVAILLNASASREATGAPKISEFPVILLLLPSHDFQKKVPSSVHDIQEQSSPESMGKALPGCLLTQHSEIPQKKAQREWRLADQSLKVKPTFPHEGKG